MTREKLKQVGSAELLKNNKTYKLIYRNYDRMVLEKYQVLPFIRMYFNEFIIKKDLNIINYFLDYNKKEDIHQLYFDTLENVDHIKISQINDYILEKANQNSNIDLKFKKAYILENKNIGDLKEESEDDNIVNDYLDNQGVKNIQNILALATAIYLLKIINDLSE